MLEIGSEAAVLVIDLDAVGGAGILDATKLIVRLRSARAYKHLFALIVIEQSTEGLLMQLEAELSIFHNSVGDNSTAFTTSSLQPAATKKAATASSPSSSRVREAGAGLATSEANPDSSSTETEEGGRCGKARSSSSRMERSGRQKPMARSSQAGTVSSESVR